MLGEKYRSLQLTTSQLQYILESTLPALRRNLQGNVEELEKYATQCAEVRCEQVEMEREKSRLEEAIKVCFRMPQYKHA
ncbi:hypothetical protein EON65_22815 [archaeon]|nr:MAG: hypothetical protein EON65_22815 [archaeon]